MQLTNPMCLTQLILTPQRVASPKQLGPGLESFIRKVVLLKEKKGVVAPRATFVLVPISFWGGVQGIRSVRVAVDKRCVLWPESFQSL